MTIPSFTSPRSTSVVILAQGDQKRIPGLLTPKQLLPLPACGGTAILDRTLRMVHELARVHPMVVGWPTFRDHYTVSPVKIGDGAIVRPLVVTLEKPGNSSLKGVHQVFQMYQPHTARTVVLLGDVVYSWSTLEELLAVGPGTPNRDVVFAVSSDLSGSTGELWGIAWNQTSHASMMSALDRARGKQPYNTDVYQNGQMRLWLWEWEELCVMSSPQRYVTDALEGDYITDIDLPTHITPEFLNKLSMRAAFDDAAHGITW